MKHCRKHGRNQLNRLNQSNQLERYILINSLRPLNEFKFQTKDLESRINSFLSIGIELPTDEILKVIIMKSFSDKQINLDIKICDYIIKNVERSYKKMIKLSSVIKLRKEVQAKVTELKQQNLQAFH